MIADRERLQDAFEFFQFLTQRVRQEEHRFSCNPASIFEHAMEDRLECMSCKRVRYRSINTSDFALLIPDEFSHSKSTNDAGDVEWPEVSLQRCLEASQQPSLIDYRCPHCNTETKAQTYCNHASVSPIGLTMWRQDDEIRDGARRPRRACPPLRVSQLRARETR